MFPLELPDLIRTYEFNTDYQHTKRRQPVLLPLSATLKCTRQLHQVSPSSKTDQIRNEYSKKVTATLTDFFTNPISSIFSFVTTSILTTMSIPPSFNRSSFRFLRRCSFRFLSIEVHSDSYDDAHSVFLQSKSIPILKFIEV